MRLWLTGGTGFVGSNILEAGLTRGWDVLTTVHSFRPVDERSFAMEGVDITDDAAVLESIHRFEPDVVVHCAILNDWHRMYADRRLAWDSYVGATKAAASGARDVGAAFIVVSTDWVFDGTQGGADEDTPPNPINLYGVLKMASEIVALERGGAVARVSGVNGLHRLRPQAPRTQDPGFGYFVASLVDTVRAGRAFAVWESADINMRATPSLASECAELILRIGERRLDGIFHTCGGEAMARMDLAMLACDVFDLDPSLVTTGPPEPAGMPSGPIPYDTSITMPRTAELLDHSPSSARSLLERFRQEYESAA